MGEFSSEFLVSLETLGQTHLGLAWPVVYNLLKISIIVIPILGAVAYLTLWERKLIGWMHLRLGPNRVGPLGLLQPIADSLKLLTKEIILPMQASKGLYLLAPVMTIMPALAAWAVIPFGPDGGDQEIVLVTKVADDQFKMDSLLGVRYVPLCDHDY